MSIGVTEEHRALAEAVSGWASQHAPIALSRRAAEDGGKEPAELWDALVSQGLLGMHVTEDFGGDGGTYVEAAVTAYEFGRQLAVGGFLPTLIASAVLQLDAGPAASRLASVISGETAVAVAFTAKGMTAHLDGDELVVTGVAPAVLGAATANLLVLGAETDDGDRWFIAEANHAS